MKILAFDTSLRACSAAVWIDNQIKARCFEARSRGHAEVLIPMINKVCEVSGLSFGEFDRIAVTLGPGTFAGVRVGIAAARGLSVSLDLPVFGISSLEAVAAGVLSELRDHELHVTVLFDARRGQVYVQSFDPELKPLGEPQVLTPEKALEGVPIGTGLVVGDGIAVLGDALTRARPDLRPAPGSWQPDAVIIAGLALGREVSAPGSGAPKPIYLRPPDARPPVADGGGT